MQCFPRKRFSGHDVQRAFFGFFACGTVGRGFLKIQILPCTEINFQKYVDLNCAKL